MAEPTAWICPTCKLLRTTPYCEQCGEQPLRPNDLTLRDLATQLSQWLTSIDGRLIRSLRMLVLSPGALTVAHIEGRRRAFIGPIQLFLVANALFFAVQSLTHTDILSSPLDSHLNHQDWSAFAGTLVAQRLGSTHTTLADYAPIFDRAVVLNAKALIILMALAFAPFLIVLFFDAHRPVGAHLVFSLHLYAFILLLFCLSLLMVEANILTGGIGLASRRLDVILSLFNLGVCATYLYLSIGPAYGASGVSRLARSAILAMSVALIVVGYRFAIFLVTLYST